MENDFSYEQLSPRSFEQLSVAVAESVIGAGIEVYGPGPDGGEKLPGQARSTGRILTPMIRIGGKDTQ